MYQSKAKDLELKRYPLRLGTISKDFTLDNIKNRVKRKCKSFFVDYNAIDASNIFDIHRYLMKRR